MDLERSVALLKAQQEASIDGILIVDEHRKVVSFNRRFLEMWKIDPAVAARADDHALLSAVVDSVVESATFLARVAHLYEHPDERSRDEVRLRDGRTLDRYSAPVIGDDQHYFGRVWFFRDVTDQRRAEQAVKEYSQLDQYLLEEKIGEGGMGIVYRARHALLRRPTAIKLLPLERAGQASIRRFEREVQITSQLTHPNTIVIFDYGRAKSGAFYYAMEYLDGINLAQLVERYGPQSPARVVRILEQACGALAEAHALGLIHRDVKPANVMLTERMQAPDFVKVLDFGLVKQLDSDESVGSVDSQMLTGAGTISGTPRFMSPESVAYPDKIDARSDLYGLGALAYFLLTAQPVFDTKILTTLLMEVMHVTPRTPSLRLGREIPADLEKVVMSCLAKSPDDRPASAIVLRKALLACACAHEFDEQAATTWWKEHRAGKTSSPPEAPPNSLDTIVGTDWKGRARG